MWNTFQMSKDITWLADSRSLAQNVEPDWAMSTQPSAKHSEPRQKHFGIQRFWTQGHKRKILRNCFTLCMFVMFNLHESRLVSKHTEEIFHQKDFSPHWVSSFSLLPVIWYKISDFEDSFKPSRKCIKPLSLPRWVEVCVRFKSLRPGKMRKIEAEGRGDSHYIGRKDIG